MRPPNPRALVSVLCLTISAIALAQSPPQRNPDISNKALITKSTPGINPDAFKNQSVSTANATLHKLSGDYYAWRNENYPLLDKVRAMKTDNWPKDERIDWILFRAQLENIVLKAYEGRQAEIISFLKEHNLVTLPSYLGAFQIRQLPDAFKPTSPGGS